jgi:hypothetical protein
MNAARPASTALLKRSGIAGAALSGGLNFGLPAFLTAYGSGPLTFLLIYVWAGVLSPAGALCWLLGRPWSLELHGSLFKYWPQILASWLIDSVLLGAVAAALLVMHQKLFRRIVETDETA